MRDLHHFIERDSHLPLVAELGSHAIEQRNSAPSTRQRGYVPYPIGYHNSACLMRWRGLRRLGRRDAHR